MAQWNRDALKGLSAGGQRLNRPFLRVQLRRLYWALMNMAGTEVLDQDLRRAAMVFSPHPDDETLGCGGTILKMRRAGTQVKIVMMTEGGKSHNLVPEAELKAIRASEAIAAGRSLGLNPSDILSLGFDDSRLAESIPSATRQVEEILRTEQPGEVFIPYRRDEHQDHSITNQIVVSALRKWGGKATIYEYPIWFWSHWPWVSLPKGGRQEYVGALKNSVLFPLILLSEFRFRVYVADLLDLKRAALEQYKSQMTRLVPDPSWWTLGDASNGEFLECFFQDFEIFRRYTLAQGSAEGH